MKPFIKSPVLGDLYVNQSFAEVDDIPFFCTLNSNDSLYLASQMIFGEYKYLLVEINYDTLQKLLKGDIDIRSVYTSADGCYVVWDHDNDSGVEDSYIPANKLDHSILQDQGVKLQINFSTAEYRAKIDKPFYKLINKSFEIFRQQGGELSYV